MNLMTNIISNIPASYSFKLTFSLILLALSPTSCSTSFVLYTVHVLKYSFLFHSCSCFEAPTMQLFYLCLCWILTLLCRYSLAIFSYHCIITYFRVINLTLLFVMVVNVIFVLKEWRSWHQRLDFRYTLCFLYFKNFKVSIGIVYNFGCFYV